MGKFSLVAIVRNRKLSSLFRIPLHQSIEEFLMESWTSKLEPFVYELEQIDYEAGYQLKRHQCFRMLEFELPNWIAGYNSQSATLIDEIVGDPQTYRSVQGTVAFTKINEEESMIFQDFSRSKAINPGRFLQFDGQVYRTAERTGLLLDRQLSAVYLPGKRMLLFRNFRAVNSYLPIFEFFKKQSEQKIRKLLDHHNLATEHPDIWAKGANQWFRARFIKLGNSGILDRYSAKEIKSVSEGYDVPIELVNNRIVFPADSNSAKKILQFLNEEFFRGAITGRLYETNSKKSKK